jgi:hypothetical protein
MYDYMLRLRRCRVAEVEEDGMQQAFRGLQDRLQQLRERVAK